MRKIGEYTVEDKPIGIGGMGKIFKGTDAKGRQVAIKETLPQYATDLTIRDRIEQEIKILWSLDHKSIVKIYSSFFDEKAETYNAIMELVDGMNLEQYIDQNGPVAEPEAVRLMSEILDVMQYVHSKGYIHRDIKPSNIMIRENGSICLLDFGVAKDLNNNVNKTQYGTIIGTDGYMSPEQAEGFSIDNRSDIYALGCVLFYMLTGHHAFDTLGSDYETQEAIRKQDFPKLKKYKVKHSKHIQLVLDKATHKDMLRRYQTCSDFSAGLRTATQVNTGVGQAEPIKISIGSEMCDIIISDPGHHISRHHADVTLKEFTGGKYYVFTDTSSNGTVVNKRMVKQESITIRYDDPDPVIFLANIIEGRLDWNRVKEMLQQRTPPPSVIPDGSIPPAKPISLTRGYMDSTPNQQPTNKKWMIALFVVAVIIIMLLTVLITLVLQQAI